MINDLKPTELSGRFMQHGEGVWVCFGFGFSILFWDSRSNRGNIVADLALQLCIKRGHTAVYRQRYTPGSHELFVRLRIKEFYGVWPILVVRYPKKLIAINTGYDKQEVNCFPTKMDSSNLRICGLKAYLMMR